MKNQPTYPCIHQFAQFVELKDFRPATKAEYVRYLRKCAQHFQCDPRTLTEDQVREYFLFLRQHKHYGGSSMNVAKVTLRAFFQDCLKVAADWSVFKDLQIRRPEPLPFVLSRAEVAAVLGAVREPRFRAWKERSCTLSESLRRATVPMSVRAEKTQLALAALHTAVTPSLTASSA